MFSRNSTKKPLNFMQSPIFTNTSCKSACLHNAPSLHTVDFFSNFSGAAGISSHQNPRLSRQKSLISLGLFSREMPNFLARTPSCGRPPPHRNISGLKSLGLCSSFVPDRLSAWSASLDGHFGPKKKKKSPPPPPKIPQFAADTLPAPRPLPSWTGIFNKNLIPPPPPGASDSPVPLPEKQKNNKKDPKRPP